MTIHLAPRIVVDPAIRSGRPVIEGTHVPVELVVAKLAGGVKEEEVAAEYDLTTNDIRAALSYAVLVLASHKISEPG